MHVIIALDGNVAPIKNYQATHFSKFGGNNKEFSRAIREEQEIFLSHFELLSWSLGWCASTVPPVKW